MIKNRYLTEVQLLLYNLYQNKTEKNLLEANNDMRNINNKNKFAFP